MKKTFEKAVQGYEQAFQMGRKAFHNGMKCAPVNDKNYMEFVYKNRQPMTIESMERSIQLAGAWIGGWTVENLAG